MKKLTKEVFLGVRLLLSLYFVLLSLSLSASLKSSLLIFTVLYFSLGLLCYFKPGGTGFINKFVDVFFLPLLVFLSGEEIALYTLIPAIVVHTVRNPLSAVFLLFSGVFLSVYSLYREPLWLFSTLILFIASPLSALIPDYTSALKKERDYMKNLKNSYRKLLKDFARWEKDRKELENLDFLLEISTECPDIRDFLRSIKRRFNLKRIHVVPKGNLEDYSPLMDKERGLLSVPVKLEEGNAVVIFEMESPFQLNDDILVSSLERAGKMVSLYIAGFSGESPIGKALNIG